MSSFPLIHVVFLLSQGFLLFPTSVLEGYSTHIVGQSADVFCADLWLEVDWILGFYGPSSPIADATCGIFMACLLNYRAGIPTMVSQHCETKAKTHSIYTLLNCGTSFTWSDQCSSVSLNAPSADLSGSWKVVVRQVEEVDRARSHPAPKWAVRLAPLGCARRNRPSQQMQQTRADFGPSISAYRAARRPFFIFCSPVVFLVITPGGPIRHLYSGQSLEMNVYRQICCRRGKLSRQHSYRLHLDHSLRWTQRTLKSWIIFQV